MPRITRAQSIEQENEQHALEFFRQVLDGLPDPRRAQGKRYPLPLVIMTALMAAVCGCDNAEAMEIWGRTHRQWLADLLPTPHGTPTQDVFLAVFAALDPKAFEPLLRSWAALLRAQLTKAGKHIAIDGKTSRRSADLGKGIGPLHMLSAYLTEAGLVLGSAKTKTKSNEIVAISELLDTLDLRGATITIDAMGTQTRIAKAIVDGGGHYLLAVKGNQPILHEDITTVFAEADDTRVRTVDEAQRPVVDRCEEVDKGHGRVEERKVKVCRELDWLSTAKRWKGLSFVAQVHRERTVLSTGKTTTEVAYYIGSDPTATVEQIGHLIRRHWAIENELHWVLDIAFREDDARHRAGNAAQNMAILRHFALNIIKQDKTRKLGVANTRLQAAFDRNYMLKLLAGAIE